MAAFDYEKDLANCLLKALIDKSDSRHANKRAIVGIADDVMPDLIENGGPTNHGSPVNCRTLDTTCYWLAANGWR